MVGLEAEVEAGMVNENLDFVLRTMGKYGRIFEGGESLAQICVLERPRGFREEGGLEWQGWPLGDECGAGVQQGDGDGWPCEW